MIPSYRRACRRSSPAWSSFITAAVDMRLPPLYLFVLQEVVGRQSQKFLEPCRGAQPHEELSRLEKTAGLEASVADLAAHALHLLVDDAREAIGSQRLSSDRHSVVEPLPHLSARDLRGGRVFHQGIERHAPVPAQPSLEVLDTHPH